MRPKPVGVPDGDIFVRMAGEGPPLLLLHGYPQTSAMWHRVLPRLAQRYTVVAADLRGYGRSLKPPSAPDYATLSKRASAADMVAVMASLGHERFLVGSHDRGARVAHRMALDHPGRVRAIAMLDIAPTREMYANASSGFAQTYWHWYWLTQPPPFPERLIASDPRFFWLKCCGWGSAGRALCHWVAMDEYLERFADPGVIRCACEDYRAAWTIDISHDDADGDLKIACPLLLNWGATARSRSSSTRSPCGADVPRMWMARPCLGAIISLRRRRTRCSRCGYPSLSAHRPDGPALARTGLNPRSSKLPSAEGEADGCAAWSAGDPPTDHGPNVSTTPPTSSWNAARRRSRRTWRRTSLRPVARASTPACDRTSAPPTGPCPSGPDALVRRFRHFGGTHEF